jgi:hypothetical protein
MKIAGGAHFDRAHHWMPASVRKVFSEQLLGNCVGGRHAVASVTYRADLIAIVFEATAERQDSGGRGIEVSRHGEK